MQNSISSDTLAIKKTYSFYPIAIMSLCALFLFYKYVLQIYPSIITEQLMSEFKLNGLGLGNLAGTFYYTYTFTQLFVGVLLDRYSTRYLTTISILVCSLGALYFSQAQSLLDAEISRGAMGIGVAFATVAYMKCASTWFAPKQYAFVSGLLVTAAMLGAVFGQTPVTLLIEQMGWRECLFAVGCAGLLLMFCFFVIVRDAPDVKQDDTSASFADVLAVVKSKQNWLLTCYAGLAFCPVAVFGGLWGNPFLQQAYFVTKTQASMLLSCIFIGLAIGSPVLGLISDRSGKRRSIMIYGTGVACALLTLVLFYHPMPVWLLGAMLLLFGFALGAFMLIFVVGKETNSLMVTATVIAMINASDAALDSIVEPLIGKLLDLQWDGAIQNGAHYFSLANYHFALAILPVFLAVATAILFWIRSE